MSKYAEDIAAEKQAQYDRGFLDATSTFMNLANKILDEKPIPENKRFSALLNAIETIYSRACERYDEHVRRRFMITWSAKRFTETILKKGDKA